MCGEDIRVFVDKNGRVEKIIDIEGAYILHGSPAIIDPNGLRAYYQRGEYHRVDGPALIHPDGRKEWWVKGKRHRLDGPAFVGANGVQIWYLYGNHIDVEAIFGYVPSVPLSPEEQMVLVLTTSGETE